MYNLYYSSHDFTESKADVDNIIFQTLTNFMATSLNPFCSNRLMMSAISPLWTASGLSIRNVRSLFPSPSPDIFKRELYALSSKPLYKEPVESLKAGSTWCKTAQNVPGHRPYCQCCSSTCGTCSSCVVPLVPVVPVVAVVAVVVPILAVVRVVPVVAVVAVVAL